MKIFKIILGIIVIALGLGMAVAGWIVFTGGQWSPIINLFLGFALGFMGAGLVWSGIMLVRGSTVRDALGGAVNALQGHGGVGLHKGGTYYAPPSHAKDLLLTIIRYAIIIIVVLLIAIFSIFRVTGGFLGGV
jgi:hypothetical protein